MGGFGQLLQTLSGMLQGAQGNPSQKRPPMQQPQAQPTDGSVSGVSADAMNAQDPLPASRRPPVADPTTQPPTNQADSPTGPRLVDRMNDDPRQTQMPEAGTDDLENQLAQPRRPLADAMQDGAGDAATADLESRIAPPDLSGRQPSDMDRLQSQYDDLGKRLDAPPPKRSLLQNILRAGQGALVGAAGETNQFQTRRQQNAQFQQNQLRERQQSLAQQIDSERRMQEQENAISERERFAQQSQTEREHYQTDSQARLFQEQNNLMDRRLAAQDGNRKPDTLEQQYDEALKSGDKVGANRLLQEMQAIGGAKQPPQRPNQQLLVTPAGKIIEARPGMTIPQGSRSMSGDLNAGQITPATQGILQSTGPVKDQVQQLLQDLEPYKNDSGRMTLDRLSYAMGNASPDGSLADDISKLELDRVVAGARVLKGSSRSFQALELAMKHAPNPWIDSKALMYQKLTNILQNLNDVEKDAIAFGQKGQTTQDAAGKITGAQGAGPTPNTHRFSVSAWKRANPTGDASAAQAAATAQRYEVVP